MDFTQQELSRKFLSQSSWYLKTFNYIYSRVKKEVEKEYVWPLSFPDCTDRLLPHFSRAKRAKCLILFGPTGVGKTTFALSLYRVV